MGRIRFILIGAVIGLTWAAGLRGYMMQLAGPTSAALIAGRPPRHGRPPGR